MKETFVIVVLVGIIGGCIAGYRTAQLKEQLEEVRKQRDALLFELALRTSDYYKEGAWLCVPGVDPIHVSKLKAIELLKDGLTESAVCK